LTRRVTAGQRVGVAGTLHPDGAVRVRVERQLSNGKWLRGSDVVLRSRGGVFRGRILLRAPGLYRLTPRAGVAARPVGAPALFLLAGVIAVEGVRRLSDPPDVAGGVVLGVALVGAVVNVAAAWALSRAERRSLNVEGARQHILTDLWASLAAAAAGLAILLF